MITQKLVAMPTVCNVAVARISDRAEKKPMSGRGTEISIDDIDVATLKRRAQALAAIWAFHDLDDGILWFRFDQEWSDEFSLGIYNDYQGDRARFYFHRKTEAVLVKGFCLASRTSFAPEFDHLEVEEIDEERLWPGMFSGIPPDLAPAQEDPDFDRFLTSFCFWRSDGDSQWRRGMADPPPGRDFDDGSKVALEPYLLPDERLIEWLRSVLDGQCRLNITKPILAGRTVGRRAYHALKMSESEDALLRSRLKRIGLKVY